MLYDLAQLIAKQGKGDLAAVGLPPQQRLGKVLGLLERDLGWHWRLVWIDHHLDQGRLTRRDGALEGWTEVLGLFHPDPDAAACLGIPGEIDRLQFYLIFRVAEEDDLFPLDLSQHIVLD